MRIGIFGGTFDPPHIAHLILASETCDQLSLDRLLWVLTPDPPHKTDRPVSPLDVRLELLQAAIRRNPMFELSLVEIDRPGPHYAVDTVRLLTRQYPDAELFYIMGGDSLRDLPHWYQPAELIAMLTGIGVMRRPGDLVDMVSLNRLFPGINRKVIFVQTPLLEISSTLIRSRAYENRPYRYFLPQAVYELIQKYGLYQRETKTQETE
ncbi:MAG TPA: nicotinate (nicotinamide) nucleotide adenylyltransferase [Chloroflexi bacterium]|nr:nicotinate (nicotinamide) nucleotide adenylyltransferase [Chloroflexota bacterium]HPO57880.1 nicotinate-nucleotide adenylyltransferase [Anaerolineaceae bacterium]